MATTTMSEFDVVKDFGADPTGVASSSAAFQAAVNAAVAVSGKVVIPAGSYGLDQTVFIQPQGNARACSIQMEGQGSPIPCSISWDGGPGASIFLGSGLYNTRFENIFLRNRLSVPDLIFWDIRPNYTHPSSSFVTWERCVCQAGNPGGRNIGWRLGQSDPSAAYQDNNHFRWVDCLVKTAPQVAGQLPQYGDIGWQIGGWNSEPLLFENCGTSSTSFRYLGGAVFTLGMPGSTVQPTDTYLPAASTLGFKSSGLLLLSGGEIASYSGVTPASFTGLVRGLNGTTPIVFGAGGVIQQYHTDTPLYTSATAVVAATDSVINVASTAGFPAAGKIMMAPLAGRAEVITYTGLTPTSFTGCSRGALGSTATAFGQGALVFQYLYGPTMGALSPAGVMTWLGGGGSQEGTAFCFPGGGRYTIIGDRCENPGRYLHSGAGNSGYASAISLIGCEILNADPLDGVLFALYSAPLLSLQSCRLSRLGMAGFDANMFSVHSSAEYGSISVADSTIGGTAPLCSFPGGKTWPMSCQRVIQCNQNGAPLGFFPT